MNRFGVLLIVLAAAVTGACGGADEASSSPTAPSTPTTTAPPSQPPPTPPQTASCTTQNLTVVSVQGTVVTLQWSAVSGASEYLILVGSAPSSSDQLSTNTTNTSYTWTARPGRQYARVQARCNGQYGSSSNEVEFTVGG
jgi:hypothetical protein